MKQNQYTIQTQPIAANMLSSFTIFPAGLRPSFSHDAAGRIDCLQYKTMWNQNHRL